MASLPVQLPVQSLEVVEFDRLALSENNTFDPWPNRGEPR